MPRVTKTPKFSFQSFQSVWQGLKRHWFKLLCLGYVPYSTIWVFRYAQENTWTEFFWELGVLLFILFVLRKEILDELKKG